MGVLYKITFKLYTKNSYDRILIIIFKLLLEILATILFRKVIPLLLFCCSDTWQLGINMHIPSISFIFIHPFVFASFSLQVSTSWVQPWHCLPARRFLFWLTSLVSIPKISRWQCFFSTLGWLFLTGLCVCIFNRGLLLVLKKHEDFHHEAYLLSCQAWRYPSWCLPLWSAYLVKILSPLKLFPSTLSLL